MSAARFDRQLPLFGSEGQRRLRAARVAIVGVGGTGSIVIPQLALLGVGHLSIIDHDQIEETNRNRHMCARGADPIPGTMKVDTASRMIAEYDPTITIEAIPESMLSEAAFKAVQSADFVFGCVDREGVRMILLELCMAFERPYIDIATGVEVGPPLMFGGRVCCSKAGDGCLACLGQLDIEEAAKDVESPHQQRDREAIYGVDHRVLRGTGPSVVSVNAVVSSLAVTEFLKLCTGMAAPTRLLRYDGGATRVSSSADKPVPDCYFCQGIAGSGKAAETSRFIPRPPPLGRSASRICASH